MLCLTSLSCFGNVMLNISIGFVPANVRKRCAVGRWARRNGAESLPAVLLTESHPLRLLPTPADRLG